jgi:hypothetical protein
MESGDEFRRLQTKLTEDRKEGVGGGAKAFIGKVSMAI